MARIYDNLESKFVQGLHERIAMRIAAQHGMTQDYKMARRHNMRPLKALVDRDFVLPEERE